ncbi:alcohol dehydrogenase catalytic domain-containing protein [Streptomyces sp. NPDC051104]|uniref:alcohol dehydrogenase catalytic domain-containing protein n=1 Tax=Streptomyces sp. NPDC051104 TaxID=3155044 RepID=UPI003444AE06
MTTTARAAVVESGGAPFTLSEVELDDPGQGEALARMVATGLCHTDLGVASGGLPFSLPGVLGHEGAGVVEAVGPDVTGVEPGDHVVLSFTSCGGCRNCRDGHPAYCATWLPLNLIGGRRADGTSTISRDGTPSEVTPARSRARLLTQARGAPRTPGCPPRRTRTSRRRPAISSPTCVTAPIRSRSACCCPRRRRGRRRSRAHRRRAVSGS